MDQKDTRYQSFCKAIDTLDDGVALINAYDALLHDYDGEKMYQAESQMIKAIWQSSRDHSCTACRKLR